MKNKRRLLQIRHCLVFLSDGRENHMRSEETTKALNPNWHDIMSFSILLTFPPVWSASIGPLRVAEVLLNAMGGIFLNLLCQMSALLFLREKPPSGSVYVCV